MRLHALEALLLLALTGPALAQNADRQQPMDIASDAGDLLMSEDGESTLLGNVNITQGSLHVQADKAVVQRRGGDPVSITLTGNPAVLRQVKVDGQPMTARARQIVYRMDSEIVTLTGAVEIEEPRGHLRGETIKYDMSTGRLDGGGDGNRVQMRILPKASGG